MEAFMTLSHARHVTLYTVFVRGIDNSTLFSYLLLMDSIFFQLLSSAIFF